MGKTFKEHSKANFTIDEGKNPTYEQIQTGCLQRMADAAEIQAKNSEAMAKNHNQLIRDLEYFKNRCANLQRDLDTVTRSRNVFKGKYYALKNKTP